MLIPVSSAMLLQTAPVSGLTSTQVNVLMVFAGAVTLAVLLQCVILISFAIGAAKARKEMLGLTTDIHQKAMPVIAAVQDLVEKNGPVITQAIAQVEEISSIARNKAVELDSLTTEIVMRTRQQTRRVDGMVSNSLTRVEHLRESVHHAILAPVKQVAGAVAGIRAMVESFRSNLPEGLHKMVGKFNQHDAEARVGEGEDYHA